ncbi:MAG: hypothetical protein ACAH88_02710, partial [Roseimicrobium sp.]
MEAVAAEYQWSVPVPSVTSEETGGPPRAYLWIPPTCQRVRAVVVGQHNMLEEPLLEHPAFRAALAELGMAAIWVTPAIDGQFRDGKTSGARFEEMFRAVAEESGYTELTHAPVVVIGHSAMAEFPYRFAAWNPGRTLAAISLKGAWPDMRAPGGPGWSGQDVAGVPLLFVSGEYEWAEERAGKALAFRREFPAVPFSMLADAGGGHFDSHDALVSFLAEYLRAAARHRLPTEVGAVDQPVALRSMDATKDGWLIDRWHMDKPPRAPAAPASQYRGDVHETYWCFDEAHARATERLQAAYAGKKPQLVGYIQKDAVVEQNPKTHQQVTLSFLPDTAGDGLTFKLEGTFLDKVPPGRPERWMARAAGSSVDHAPAGGPVIIRRISGPVEQISPDTFALRFDRLGFDNPRRSAEIWLLAEHPGDSQYKRAVQQSVLHFPLRNTEGVPQSITFPEIPDQLTSSTATIPLHASSSAEPDALVRYYVREGPAEISSDAEGAPVLRLKQVPARAKFPVKVTVVAWQWGRSIEPKMQSAAPVERVFHVNKEISHTAAAQPPPTPLLDCLIPGDAASEAAHQCSAKKSEVVSGALGQPARRLLPGGGESFWEGGSLGFIMKVDPDKPNYVTARFWGDEVNPNLLVLFCEGKQIGYRHLGDIDVLALPDDEPRYNGRFYYATTPLPQTLTAGKKEVRLEIRSNGPVWGYGRSFEDYQKPMTKPSRAIYRLATHTDGCYVPSADEVQGQPPEATVRKEPGEEVLIAVKKRVNNTLDNLLKSRRPVNQMQAQLLAKAYFVKWTTAFQNPKAVEQVIRCADDRYQAWRRDAPAVWHDLSTWNPDWFGLGPAADAVRLLAGPIAPALDAKLKDGTTRRVAWSEMFRSSRDWLRTHRRSITNQTIFVDTNIYRSHLAVAAIDPANAWPHEQAQRYLYECLGLAPWLGTDTADGSLKPWGANYFQLTEKGLSRELGYVGGYGEILGQMVDAYDATR